MERGSRSTPCSATNTGIPIAGGIRASIGAPFFAFPDLINTSGDNSIISPKLAPHWRMESAGGNVHDFRYVIEMAFFSPVSC